MGFCKSDQKNIPVVGFLTCNDCDVLRAKTGLYRRVTPRTIIPPTTRMWVSCWLWGRVRLGSPWVWVGRVSMRRALPRKRGKGRRGLWQRMRGRGRRGKGGAGGGWVTGPGGGGRGTVVVG